MIPPISFSSHFRRYKDVRGPRPVFFLGTFCMTCFSNFSQKWDVSHQTKAMELFPISPKIPRLFPEIPRFFPSIAIAWSHGSQPAATDLRLRTRGLARVSGAGVWKIPAVGYHPAGETPELRNSGT